MESSFQEWYEAEVSRATDEAFKVLVGGIARAYLYVKPSTEQERGALRVSVDAPKGHELVTSEPISGFWPRPKIRAFIHAAARRAPLVATIADYKKQSA